MFARQGLTRRSVALMIASAIVTAPLGHAASAKEAGGRPYQIYLLKGLADVFSSGMDFLQAKLKARGIEGEVHSHSEWDTLADGAIAKWRSGAHGPIVIIGHSLGADAAIQMAHKLGEAQVPVALLVSFSPVNSAPAYGNVARAVNYFQSNSAWHGQITRGDGFHGVLENVDLKDAPGITHFNIEKADNLHAATIAKVVTLIPSSHIRSAARVSAATSAARSATATAVTDR